MKGPLPRASLPRCAAGCLQLLLACLRSCAAAAATMLLARTQQSAVDRRSALEPPQTPNRLQSARSRSKEIAAGNFGWGTIEPLLKARAGLID
jgi:hypothetical protein